MKNKRSLEDLIAGLGEIFDSLKPFLKSSGDALIDEPYILELEKLHEREKGVVKDIWVQAENKMAEAAEQFHASVHRAMDGYTTRATAAMDSYVKALKEEENFPTKEKMNAELNSMKTQLTRKLADADTWFNLKLATVESEMSAAVDQLFLVVYEESMKIAARYEKAIKGSGNN